jgi:subtilisin family serine protease
MNALRIGIVDTGVNSWHSHVRGHVSGCRIFAGPDGRIDEDDDFHDPHGHGTAIAGIVREAFPRAHIFAVRVFERGQATYPSLVARGMLRAAAARCGFVNVSLSVPPDAASAALADACAAVVDAGCIVVASARADRPDWLPATLPGVYAVTADDTLACDDVRQRGERQFVACGRPRDLGVVHAGRNFSGDSFACARALVHLARRRRRG